MYLIDENLMLYHIKEWYLNVISTINVFLNQRNLID
ncbi:hypothetical protein JOC77_001140 [Peribacillus deserti]|uniref:Uncharacterized protein n=1 Tax=Peribacillus deserti TaxID=673318 RepID=A0ABS2QGX0_9BACI|nr:hypothetical protein [Peribacillus deserti]